MKHKVRHDVIFLFIGAIQDYPPSSRPNPRLVCLRCQRRCRPNCCCFAGMSRTRSRVRSATACCPSIASTSSSRARISFIRVRNLFIWKKKLLWFCFVFMHQSCFWICSKWSRVYKYLSLELKKQLGRVVAWKMATLLLREDLLFGPSKYAERVIKIERWVGEGKSRVW